MVKLKSEIIGMTYTDKTLLEEDVRLAWDTGLLSIEDIAYNFDIDILQVEEIVARYEAETNKPCNLTLIKRLFT